MTDPQDYLRNNVFTASARDVVAMHGEKLSDYKPVLISGDESSKSALDSLVENAQKRGCTFVTDLQGCMFPEIGNSSFNPVATRMYFGTGLIPR